MKKFSFYLAIVLAVLIIGVLCWLYFADYLETEKPAIKLNQEIHRHRKTKEHRALTFPTGKAVFPV